MAGHAWFAPEERNTILRSLKGGADWATSAALVTGTATTQVDATFADTQQAILEAQAAREKAEVREGVSTREDTYAHAATPTMTSITNRLTGAASGDAGGGAIVDIVGTLFNNPAVTIGGHAQTVLSWNLTSIVLKTVAHAAEAGQAVVITNHGTLAVTTNSAWATLAAVTPTFTSITPATGSILGGTDVRIVGTNFRDGATVKFGTVSALVTSLSATVIQCIVPAHAAGATDVVITNLSTTTVTGTGAFTFA